MFRALWFMVKVGAVAALAVWVAERPGFVNIEWLGYDIRIHVGLFIVLALAVILLSIFLYSVIRTFVDFPKSYRRYNEVKRFEKGYKALTLGLSAVAAGDTKIAVQQADKAGKLLEKDAGLSLLLKAQAAKMQGHDEEAQAAFTALLENKDAAFLGVRGLLQAALERDDFEGALKAAHKALELQPKQKWVLKTAYDMELRLHHWDEARKTLARALKAGAVTREQATSDRIAMLHVEAEAALREGKRAEALSLLEQAYKMDRTFVPGVVRLAALLHENGNRRRAVKMVERAWKAAPHPDLAKSWDGLISKDRSKKALGRMQWFERLLKVRADTAIAQMEAGRAATQEGLWGEARSYFSRAAQMEDASALVYQLWAALEDRSSGDGGLVQSYLDKAEAATPAKVWVCTRTGRIYDEWLPIAPPHGGFNTIKWDVPHALYVAGGIAAGLDRPVIAEAVLEAPGGN